MLYKWFVGLLILAQGLSASNHTTPSRSCKMHSGLGSTDPEWDGLSPDGRVLENWIIGVLLDSSNVTTGRPRLEQPHLKGGRTHACLVVPLCWPEFLNKACCSSGVVAGCRWPLKVAQGSYTVWPLEGRAAEIVLATTHHIRQPALFGDLRRRAHARKRLETKQQSEDDGVVFHRV